MMPPPQPGTGTAGPPDIMSRLKTLPPDAIAYLKQALEADESLSRIVLMMFPELQQMISQSGGGQIAPPGATAQMSPGGAPTPPMPQVPGRGTVSSVPGSNPLQRIVR